MKSKVSVTTGPIGPVVVVPDNIRLSNLPERGALSNLRSQDLAVALQLSRTPESSGGNSSPSGSYDLVTLPDGRIRVALPNTNTLMGQ